MTTLLNAIQATSLVRLQRIPKSGRIFLKMESQNPSRSIKDQVVKSVLCGMIQQRVITRETRLFEACTGNLGVSLAMCCAALNIPFTCVMDQSASFERRLLIKAYGAELIITPKEKGLKGAIAKVKQLAVGPNALVFDQFERLECRQAYAAILEDQLVPQLKSYSVNPRFFVCGSGTGTTISAFADVLKRHYPEITVILVEPATSRAVMRRPTGEHGIQGIGPGFVPKTLDLALVDGVDSVTTGVAIQYTKWLASREGIMAGISTAANVAVAQRYAEYYACDVLTVAFDTGERYLSVQGIFDGQVFAGGPPERYCPDDRKTLFELSE